MQAYLTDSSARARVSSSFPDFLSFALAFFRAFFSFFTIGVEGADVILRGPGVVGVSALETSVAFFFFFFDWESGCHDRSAKGRKIFTFLDFVGLSSSLSSSISPGDMS